MSNLKELVVAFIRTSLVPPVAGFLVTWLINHGVQIEATWVYTAVSIVMAGIWYLVFHGLELISSNPKVKRWAGIFLGYPAIPKYGENNEL